MPKNKKGEAKRTRVAGLRPFWSGAIAFGLVSIPVSLYHANRSSRVTLHLVDERGERLTRRYYCPREQRPVAGDELARGYPIGDDEYVVVEDDELDELAPEKSQEIDLKRFSPVTDIDPMYFQRAYFMAPDKGAVKAYRLLARSMEDAGRAGVATVVMRGKEYLVAIIAEQGILRAATLRFHDELRSPSDIGLPQPQQPEQAAVRRMGKAMRGLYARELDRDALSDSQRDRLLELVETKLRAGEGVVPAKGSAQPEPEQEDTADIVDLMQVLKRSVEETDKKSKPKGKSSTGRRAGATKLEARSRAALYERAQQMGIAGRSSMSKAQLAAAIRKRQ